MIQKDEERRYKTRYIVLARTNEAILDSLQFFPLIENISHLSQLIISIYVSSDSMG